MAATATTIKGTGVIAASDYKAVEWVGTLKGGGSITISMPKALCISNVDWSFADKDDTVATLEFEACYDDTKLAAGNREEPYTITVTGATAGAGEILLGVGKFKIGGTTVALTRGGGSFVCEKTIREVTADGDAGKVEGRVVMEEARPKLTLNALTFVTNVATLYSGMTTSTSGT